MLNWSREYVYLWYANLEICMLDRGPFGALVARQEPIFWYFWPQNRFFHRISLRIGPHGQKRKPFQSSSPARRRKTNLNSLDIFHPLLHQFHKSQICQVEIFFIQASFPDSTHWHSRSLARFPRLFTVN